MSVVSEEQMRAYLTAFVESYRECAEKYLPPAIRARLLRFPLLDNGTVGYVSTTLGAGFEHLGTPHDEAVRIVVGDDPVHDLLFDPPSAVKQLMHFFEIGEEDITIVGHPREPALFRNGYPLRIMTTRASVTVTSIRCEAGDWSRDIYMAQLYGNNTVELWSEANAIKRVHREIFEALNDLRQAETRSVSLEVFLAKHKHTGVLLLGDYSDSGKILLEQIKTALTALGLQRFFS